MKSTDSNLIFLNNGIPFKMKFKYARGCIILAPILVGIVSFIFWIKKQLSLRATTNTVKVTISWFHTF